MAIRNIDREYFPVGTLLTTHFLLTYSGALSYTVDAKDSVKNFCCPIRGTGPDPKVVTIYSYTELRRIQANSLLSFSLL